LKTLVVTLVAMFHLVRVKVFAGAVVVTTLAVALPVTTVMGGGVLVTVFRTVVTIVTVDGAAVEVVVDVG
jgi:hypothetical protein